MTQPVERPAARVLLIDEQQRSLLFRAQNPDTGVTFWFPPGGGIEPGEDVNETIARELFEETGLADVVIDAEIWHRRHVYAWRDHVWDQRERWFLARVQHFEPDTRRLHENEMADIEEWRWWTPDAITTSAERFVPLDLGELVTTLLREGPPPSPQAIGE